MLCSGQVFVCKEKGVYLFEGDVLSSSKGSL